MKVSFVIPSYNCVTWLPHAVESVLKQTYGNWELVIVDDASTDKTSQYLHWLESQEKHKDKIKIFYKTQNVGRSEARNWGNAHATGDLILVLDADDIATPNRAEVTVGKFKRTKADFLYGSVTVIDSIGRTLGEYRADVFTKKNLEGKKNNIVHSSVAYTPEFAKAHPYKSGEISDLGIDDWAQQVEGLLAGKKFEHIPSLIGVYRMLKSGISSNRDEKKVLAAKDAFLEGLKQCA